MEIHPVGVALIHTGRWSDMTMQTWLQTTKTRILNLKKSKYKNKHLGNKQPSMMALAQL